jgi:hypothetical protein
VRLIAFGKAENQWASHLISQSARGDHDRAIQTLFCDDRASALGVVAAAAEWRGA